MAMYHMYDVMGGWPYPPLPRGAAHISREELEDRQRVLTLAPLFADLPKRHLRSIARATGVSSYRLGETIVKEGSSGDRFFLILEGEAKVVRGGRRRARLSPGDFFGEISLLDSGPRTANVVAEAPLKVLTLAGQDFREILTDEPIMSMRVLRALASRLRGCEESIVG